VDTWKSFGFQASKDEVTKTLEKANTSGSGALNFDEFVAMIAEGRSDMTGEIQGQLSEMREIFSIFDPNGDGAISADEIEPILKEYCGIDITEEYIQELLAAVDDDGNGELDFFEFASMMAISALPAQPKKWDRKKLIIESLTEVILDLNPLLRWAMALDNPMSIDLSVLIL